MSIGAKAYSRNETLVPIACFASHPRTAELYIRLQAAPSQGASHQGVHTKEVVLGALVTDTWEGTSRRRLQASLVVVGGDGALVRGGEDARHASTRAAELIYRDLFPTAVADLTWWDLFHRVETAAGRAVARVPLATEIFDSSTVLLQLFGTGAGRILARSVAFFLCDASEQNTSVRQAEPAGTRPMAYAHRVCQSLVRNYRVSHAALEVRMAHTRMPQKRGAQSLRKLVDVGRRMAAIDLVVFLQGYSDVSARV